MKYLYTKQVLKVKGFPQSGNAAGAGAALDKDIKRSLDRIDDCGDISLRNFSFYKNSNLP
jgi:hypothetical protein